jgi:hypothetical protein
VVLVLGQRQRGLRVAGHLRQNAHRRHLQHCRGNVLLPECASLDKGPPILARHSYPRFSRWSEGLHAV